ncbi:hypothetical protein F4778DRAFT_778410 [Xylariomycetidae sp. FL2044]|nr:hypothetical protein F4778DRAFT_778410 [Xylariomycetidae sp. FL2044]
MDPATTTTTPDDRPNRLNLGLFFGNCSRPDCRERANLLACGGCRAVKYCGPAHQRAHRPQHKLHCNLIKRAREKTARLEAELRAFPGDVLTPPDPLATARGVVWGYREARPYMTARYDLVVALLNVRTGEAVEAALSELLGMLDLNRGDNQGVRSHVPALYLRLGRDREAYDFMKWYQTVPDGNWYPFLDLHGADPFEDVSRCRAETMMDLSFLAAMAHLKARLAVDVGNLAIKMSEFSSEAANGGGKEKEKKKPSYETKLAWMREDGVTEALLRRRDILERDDVEDLADDLYRQSRRLYRLVRRHNPHYWPAVLDHPERYSRFQPTIYTHGSPQEAGLAFRHTWYMWSECLVAQLHMMSVAGNDNDDDDDDDDEEEEEEEEDDDNDEEEGWEDEEDEEEEEGEGKKDKHKEEWFQDEGVD